MRLVFKILLYLSILFAVIVAQLGISLVLPFPFNNLDLLFLLLLWLLFFWSLENVLLGAIGIGFLLELFTALPFGVNLFSLPLAILLINWFMKTFFTNRSLLIIIIIGSTGVVIYRAVYLLLILASNLFFKTIAFAWQDILLNISAEIILTTIALAVMYLIGLFFTARLRSQYIDLSRRYF